MIGLFSFIIEGVLLEIFDLFRKDFSEFLELADFSLDFEETSLENGLSTLLGKTPEILELSNLLGNY